MKKYILITLISFCICIVETELAFNYCTPYIKKYFLRQIIKLNISIIKQTV